MFLDKEINELEARLPEFGKKNTEVSQRSVGWHIDHSLRVMNGICTLVRDSDPKDYKWKFNAARTYTFWKGSIKRGVARAPKQVMTEDEPNIEEVRGYIEKAKKKLAKLEQLPKKSHFDHPYLGVLHRDHSKKMIKLHTKHHLKIIRDIIDA